jgi:hypothetical protein
MRVVVALLVVGFLATTAVSAQSFYKCPQKDGSIAFMEEPCGPKAAKIEIVQQSAADADAGQRAIYATRVREYAEAQVRARQNAAWQAGQAGQAERTREAQERQLAQSNAQLQEQNRELVDERDRSVKNARIQAAASQVQAQSQAAAAQAQSMVPTFNSKSRQWCTTTGGFTECH